MIYDSEPPNITLLQDGTIDGWDAFDQWCCFNVPQWKSVTTECRLCRTSELDKSRLLAIAFVRMTLGLMQKEIQRVNNSPPPPVMMKLEDLLEITRKKE